MDQEELAIKKFLKEMKDKNQDGNYKTQGGYFSIFCANQKHVGAVLKKDLLVRQEILDNKFLVK